MNLPPHPRPETATHEGPLASFRPPPWAAGPHAQTLWARVLRPGGDVPVSAERWETPDGDFLDLELWPDPGSDAPVVLVLHGLEGSSRRRYVRSACRHLLLRGVHAVALSFRGCGADPNRLPRMYHSGETGDVTWVLGELRARHPRRALGAWGFSLGGNVLLKLLGERPREARDLLDAALALSVPFDLSAGGDLLERTRMGQLYAAYFLRSLRRKLSLKAHLLQGLIDLDAAFGARTLRAFDDAATAPLHGFRDAAHYYDVCSSARYVGAIEAPTFVLHSLDDPFLPAGAVPRGALERNPRIHAALPTSGGHVGFLGGTLRRPRFRGEEEGARLLAEALR